MSVRDWWNGIWEHSQSQPQLALTPRVVQAEDAEITSARYAATAHAQSGDYRAAVADLQRVHELETVDGSDANCFSEIRRAKYLQKAGEGDKAWQLFRGLLARHGNEPWTAIDLFDAMRLHLQREGRAGEAIHYGVAHRLARVELYRAMKADAHAALAGPIESYGSERLEGMIRQNHQSSIELAEKWLSELTDAADLAKLAKTLCRKAGVTEQTDKLVERLQREIERQTGPFDYLKAEGVE